MDALSSSLPQQQQHYSTPSTTASTTTTAAAAPGRIPASRAPGFIPPLSSSIDPSSSFSSTTSTSAPFGNNGLIRATRVLLPASVPPPPPPILVTATSSPVKRAEAAAAARFGNTARSFHRGPLFGAGSRIPPPIGANKENEGRSTPTTDGGPARRLLDSSRLRITKADQPSGQASKLLGGGQGMAGSKLPTESRPDSKQTVARPLALGDAKQAQTIPAPAPTPSTASSSTAPAQPQTGTATSTRPSKLKPPGKCISPTTTGASKLPRSKASSGTTISSSSTTTIAKSSIPSSITRPIKPRTVPSALPKPSSRKSLTSKHPTTTTSAPAAAASGPSSRYGGSRLRARASLTASSSRVRITLEAMAAAAAAAAVRSEAEPASASSEEGQGEEASQIPAAAGPSQPAQAQSQIVSNRTAPLVKAATPRPPPLPPAPALIHLLPAPTLSLTAKELSRVTSLHTRKNEVQAVRITFKTVRVEGRRRPPSPTSRIRRVGEGEGEVEEEEDEGDEEEDGDAGSGVGAEKDDGEGEGEAVEVDSKAVEEEMPADQGGLLGADGDDPASSTSNDDQLQQPTSSAPPLPHPAEPAKQPQHPSTSEKKRKLPSSASARILRSGISPASSSSFRPGLAQIGRSGSSSGAGGAAGTGTGTGTKRRVRWLEDDAAVVAGRKVKRSVPPSYRSGAGAAADTEPNEQSSSSRSVIPTGRGAGWVVGKSCLTPRTHALKLDSLGNAPDLDKPLPIQTQLRRTKVVVKRYVYDGEGVGASLLLGGGGGGDGAAAGEMAASPELEEGEEEQEDAVGGDDVGVEGAAASSLLGIHLGLQVGAGNGSIPAQGATSRRAGTAAATAAGRWTTGAATRT
ncbi:hypothetical protein V8E36_009105 [Tilletia maclaganii]